EYADQAQGRDDLSRRLWKTIATHGREAGEIALALGLELELPPELARLLDLGGRLHDWGKAHPAFDSSIRTDGTGMRPARTDLAKAPAEAWAPLNQLYCLDEEHGKRRGFRHELASTLALFEVLHRIDPEPVLPDGEPVPHSSLIDELVALDRRAFDLLCYLISSHHGKVRGGWQGRPHDQSFPSESDKFVGVGQPLHGVREGDVIPGIPLAA